MRSLYTDDISGCRSKPSILDKKYYRQKYQKQTQKQERNPEKTYKFEWYVPLPKVQKPAYEKQPYRNTIKMISEQTGLSRSMHEQSLKKDNAKYQERKYDISSILSQSGLTSVNKPRQSMMNPTTDPYYPHRIRDKNDPSYSTRFTGNREWNYTPRNEVHLPDPRSQYISRWNKI